MAENIRWEVEQGIGTLTIQRPKALNALNAETMMEIEAVVDQVANDDSIRVVIITGDGEKAFVAGADIAYMANMTAIEGRKWGMIGQRVFQKIEDLPQPVIAAVNGFALGGGCELAMACDIRYASD
ncbi:MAG: enoyl-CoA hydratase/isomerase family protein, partial [Negativicutes bacterium]|nr:enoyl-CoA hydratase/isomerase family protein [Negativicutes bacterium]